MAASGGIGKSQSFMGKHKKKFGIGGGIAALLLMIVMAFIALLPLKIEAMMKVIIQKRITNFTERAVERRGTSIAELYVAKTLAAGGESGVAADAEFKKLTVNTGHLAKDYFKTNRVNKFAERLSSQGIKFTPDGVGKVTIEVNGKAAPFGSHEGRLVMNDAIRKETKWFQVLKRRHLRTWMRNALGIQKWKFFKGAKGDEEAKKEIRANLIDSASDGHSKKMPDVIKCALENSCDESHNAADGTQDTAVKDGIKEAEKAAQDTTKQASTKLTTQALQKIFGDELAKQIGNVFAKANGPLMLLGFIDIASRLDHFFWSGNADKQVVGMHKVELATQFTQWLTITDHMKNGRADSGKPITSDEVNAIMEQTGNPAKSAGFQQDFLNRTDGKGQLLTTSNDGKSNVIGHTVNEQNQPIANAYQNGTSLGGPILSLHTPLNAWYQSGRIVMDIVNTPLGWVASKAEAIIPGIGWLMGHVTSFLTDVFLKYIPSAVNGLETDGDLFNNLDAGGAVTEQGFMKDLGAHKVTPAQAMVINEDIAATQAETNQHLSLATRLFSPDNAGSLVNSLAVRMPSSASAAISQSVNYVASIISNPFLWFGQVLHFIPFSLSPSASAAGLVDLYGLNNYDFTEQDLSRPVDDASLSAELNPAAEIAAARLNMSVDDVNLLGKMDLTDCPETDAQKNNDEVNMCRLDVAALQSLNATQTSEDDGGLDGGTNAAPAAGNATVAAGSFAWPVTLAGSSVSSCYGPRSGGFHPGLDIAQAIDTPVYAAVAGTVIVAGPVSGYGNNFVAIKNSDTLITSYGHMNSMSVKVGDTVTKGQQIGVVGNQGASSGPHLHFNTTVGANPTDIYNGNADPLTSGLSLPSGVPNPNNCQ